MKIEQYFENITISSVRKETKGNEKKYESKLDAYVAERCTNIHDELVRFRRDKKKLARVASSSLDLIMEQGNK